MISANVDMTKTKSLISAILTVVTVCLMASCGGVNNSNPQSVAEKAISCYHIGDYETLKTLIDPANDYMLNEADKMIELSRKYKEEHPDAKPEEVPFTYKETTDALTGGEVTESTKSVKVTFDSEKWPRIVVLEKVDGKWYFDKFK